MAILDADKEGFLRSETSLMQTIGRAARNVNSKVILYGDKVTDSMQKAITETERRRKLQQAYNEKHGITPETVKKAIHRGIEAEANAHAQANAAVGRTEETQYITDEYIAELETEMHAAADAMEFERAAAIRDRIEQMRDAVGQPVDSVKEKSEGKGRGRRGKRKGGREGRVPRPKKNV